jgi:hypothetical protein
VSFASVAIQTLIFSTGYRVLHHVDPASNRSCVLDRRSLCRRVLCCSFFARIYLAVVSCLFLSLRFGDAVALPSGRRAIHRRRHTFTGKSSALPLLKTALASSAKAVCVTFFRHFKLMRSFHLSPPPSLPFPAALTSRLFSYLPPPRACCS